MERPAFDRLLTANLPKIKTFAQIYSAKCNIGDEWQDIAQTAILKMLKFADSFDPDPAKGDFAGWAYVVVANAVKSHAVKNAGMRLMEIDCNAYRQLQSPNDPETDLQTAFILDNLNEETRLYVEGYTYSEISARYGLRSKVSAFKRVKKCANKLRYILNGTTPPKVRMGRPPKKVCA